MSSQEGKGEALGDETFDVSSLPPSETIDPTIRINKWIPGTVIGYKGEPSAKELALLEFPMTPAERLAATGIMARILEREAALDRQGAEAIEARIQRIVRTISEQGRAADLVEVFQDPIELGDPHFQNGGGATMPDTHVELPGEANAV